MHVKQLAHIIHSHGTHRDPKYQLIFARVLGIFSRGAWLWFFSVQFRAPHRAHPCANYSLSSITFALALQPERIPHTLHYYNRAFFEYQLLMRRRNFTCPLLLDIYIYIHICMHRRRESFTTGVGGKVGVEMSTKFYVSFFEGKEKYFRNL